MLGIEGWKNASFILWAFPECQIDPDKMDKSFCTKYFEHIIQTINIMFLWYGERIS
jgi:hypothetical protein